MELQWPLILFTTFLGSCAGLFATMGVYALLGKGQKAQLPALITSVVLMAVGGVSVFMHLQHWERIFNGFGHITSGITQELICIVVMVILMIVAFVYIRRNSIPKVVAILMVAVGVIMVIVMGMSYMMASRPAWNNILQILSLLGLACAVGPALFAIFDREEEDAPKHGLFTLIGTAVNAVCTCAYIAVMAAAVNSYVGVGNYFDPNHPTAGMEYATQYSPFVGDAMTYTVVAIVAVIAALVLAFVGKKSGKWTIFGALIAVCAVVGAIALRAVFYCCGGSVFMFF